MVRRKIIWSNKAKISLYEILEFFNKRNKSKLYSRKLYKSFHSQVKRLSNQPEIGIETEMPDIRGLIINEYILYYEITLDSIIIHKVWDSRQNPENLEIL